MCTELDLNSNLRLHEFELGILVANRTFHLEALKVKKTITLIYQYISISSFSVIIIQDRPSRTLFKYRKNRKENKKNLVITEANCLIFMYIYNFSFL